MASVIVFVIFVLFWGATVSWRVIHTRSRRYLFYVIFLMLFWIAIRFIKWELVDDINARRQLWYLYYLPILMIPMQCLCIAVFLGKSEYCRFPVSLRFVWGLTGLLVLFVLFNDMHRLVFSFPADAVIWSDEKYYYEAGYFVVIGWIGLCVAATIGIMIRKTRRFKSKRLLIMPFSAIAFLVIYAILYDQHMIPRFFILHDMTLMICLGIVIILEGCIQSGLIPSNTHYADLFRLSTIDGQIADRLFQVQLTSGSSLPLEENEIRRAVEEPEKPDKESREIIAGTEDGRRIRLAAAPLKNGYVLWREDISEISEVLAELADMSEYLTARKTALQKEVDTSRKERQLAEKNRLYNELMDEIKEEIDSFEELLAQIEAQEDPVALREMTKRLAILCTHIKRRGNLIFLAQQDGSIDSGELLHAVEEWMSNLRLGGTVCGNSFDINIPVAFSDMLFLYDAFQKILLHALDGIDSIFVNCYEKEGKPALLVTLACGADFAGFAVSGVTVTDEDGDEKVLEIVPGASVLKGGGSV